MKVLLLSPGTRGDVQPLLALAIELRALGHETRLCAAPNFKDWVESLGFPHVPLGPDLRQAIGAPVMSPEQQREYAVRDIRGQFLTLPEAARGCALILSGCSFAARSVAESLKIPHIFVEYSPAVWPSPDHPAPLPGCHYPRTLPASTNLALWTQYEQMLNDVYRATLNEEHMKLGLAPVESVLRHMTTNRPWLAADAVLAPAAASADMQVLQTGACHESLFPRVTAVVHHGGAGTTTATARAGKPQLIVPRGYDQDYWAHRVQQLGVGISGPAIESLTLDGLVAALRACLHPEVTARAQQLASRIKLDGARLAARRIDREFA